MDHATAKLVMAAIEASDLPRPAKFLARVLLDAGQEWLMEDWVLREVRCCSKRLREYRGRLNSTGLVRVRRYGPFLGIIVRPDAREKCHALLARAEERVAKSATLPLFELPPSMLTDPLDDLEEADAREKCHAERAKSATLPSPEEPTAGDFGPENPDAREKCHAGRAKSATRTPSGWLDGINTVNFRALNNQPTNPEGGVGETIDPPTVALSAAIPKNPDYARNLALLTDPEVGIGDADLLELFAGGLAFDELLGQVFAARRDVAARARSGDPIRDPGAWLAHRLRKHLAAPGRRAYRAPKLTRDDLASDLYRRHLVISVTEDPVPDDEPVAEASVEESAPECELWALEREQLRNQVSRPRWDEWIRDSRAELVGGVLTVSVPSEEGRDWLDRRLRPVIERRMAGREDAPAEIMFVTV